MNRYQPVLPSSVFHSVVTEHRYEHCGCQRGDVFFVPVPAVKEGIRAEKIMLDIQFGRNGITAKVRILIPASVTGKVTIPVNRRNQPIRNLRIQQENGTCLVHSFTNDLENTMGPDSTTKGFGHYFDITENATEQWITIASSISPLSIECTGETEYLASLRGLSKWREISDVQLVFRSDLAPLKEHKLPEGGSVEGNEFHLQVRDSTVDLGAIVYIIKGRTH